MFKINIFATFFHDRNEMNGILITGTDTDVGKTYTALRIIELSLSHGIKTNAMKPFETGCRLHNQRLIPSDATKLMKAAGMTALDAVNQYRFRAPLAPYVAARLEHKHIDIQKVVHAYHELSGKSELVIVEGAGGLLVPITGEFSYATLARELSLSVLVVSSNRLGAINQTLLTVEYMIDHGTKLLGVILNNAGKRTGIARETNAVALSSLLGERFIGEAGYDRSERGSSRNAGLYERIIGLAVSGAR